MALRKINLTVGGTPFDKARTKSYKVDDGKVYEIPTYTLQIVGTTADGLVASKTYEVFRFGVQKKTLGSPTKVVGMAKPQSYIIWAWLPTYSPRSVDDPEVETERGAWQVVGDFLIHDGPDNPRDETGPLYASIGCIEVCGGPKGFDEFNNYLISLSGSTKPTRNEQLAEIGKAGIMKINYLEAKRPPLKEWKSP